MTHKKNKNGYTITLEKWGNTIIILKGDKVIKRQKFDDYIKAYIVFKTL